MAAMVLRKEEVNNKILASLPSEEFAELESLLQPVGLESGDRLYDLDEVLSHIHFVDGGLLSLLSTLEDGTSIEVGSLGREGMGGLTALLGSDRATHTGLVQVGGMAYRMKVAHARDVFNRLPEFQEKTLRYARMLVSQISMIAACNTLHTVEERLARWLLMCRQRLESDRLPLTQEFLSHMLGVRRSGVTVAVGILEQAGLISHRRGTIVVTNPDGLREASCECIKAMTAEYDGFLKA
jgi:CRP-like cAMP-binding protein